jgi:hypothetical protein
MGYGSYSASDWQKLKTSRKLSSDRDVHEIFKRTSCNPKFDPRFIGTRECFDSEDHPNSTPIVVGLDVTGSMGYLAVKVASEALNDLILKLYSTGAVEDPALMCAAYGDYLDKSPLQVTQFESDIRIAEQLLDIWFENCGSGDVVPTCLWEFLSRHTDIDSIRKRNKKGFVFTIGDGAEIRKDAVGRTIMRVVGDDLGPDVTVADILKETEKKFHVFHIMIGNDGNSDILYGHRIVIAQYSIDCIPEIILGAIQLQNGKSLEDVIAGCDEIKKPTVDNALRQLCLSDTGSAIRF